MLQRDAREQPAGRERRVLRACASGREADGDGELVGEVRAAVRPEASRSHPAGIVVGERGQDVAERRVRRLPRVGAAAADGGGRHLAKALRALRRQTRLPDSRCPEDGDEVRTAFGGRALECFDDLAELPVAPHERRLEPAEQRRRVGVDGVDRPGVLPRRGRDGVAHDPPGPGGGEHVTRVAPAPGAARPRRPARPRRAGRRSRPRRSRGRRVAATADERSATAAVTARSESSSWAAGTPNTPSTRPPPSDATLAPCRSSSRSAARVRSSSAARRASGSSGASVGLTSATRTVTSFRDSAGCGGGDAGAALGRRVERGILTQHRPLQLLQLAPGLGSQLVDERPARVARTPPARPPVSPSGRARAISWRRSRSRYGSRATSSSSSATSCTCAAERKVGVDPLLERREAELVEVRGGLARRLGREIGERRTAPERESLSQAVGGRGRLGAVGLLDEAPERVEIELARRDPEEVPGRARDEPVAELATQPDQVVLERRLRRRRRIVAPDAVDEPVDRDDAVRLEQQQCRAPRAGACHRPRRRARRPAPRAGRGS